MCQWMRWGSSWSCLRKRVMDERVCSALSQRNSESHRRGSSCWSCCPEGSVWSGGMSSQIVTRWCEWVKMWGEWGYASFPYAYEVFWGKFLEAGLRGSRKQCPRGETCSYQNLGKFWRAIDAPSVTFDSDDSQWGPQNKDMGKWKWRSCFWEFPRNTISRRRY